MPETARSARLTLATALVAALWAASAALGLRSAEGAGQAAADASSLAVSISLHGLFFVAASLLLLRLSSESPADIGMTLRRAGRAVALGSLLGVLLLLLHVLALQPALESTLPPGPGQAVDIEKAISGPGDLALFLLLSVFKGGFAEELWRATAVTRFERRLGRPGLLLALLVSSAAFGLEHAHQGLDAVVTATVMGLAFALLYLRRRRLLEPVAAHAAFDVAGLIMGYAVTST